MTDQIEWQQVCRTHRVARFIPTITIRRSGNIAISSDFVRKAGIAECTCVALFLSADKMRLAFKFSTDTNDNDAFSLTRDGGSGNNNRNSGLNRVICAKSLLMQSPTVQSLIKEASTAARRYEPYRTNDGLWVINLTPCFERIASTVSDLPGDVTGIYRYLRGKEVVYIGRGALKSRAQSHERKHWDFDRIEYSILNDNKSEVNWEKFWLDDHRRQYGAWPAYNRIAGISSEVA
jgi:hypothetical protein